MSETSVLGVKHKGAPKKKATSEITISNISENKN